MNPAAKSVDVVVIGAGAAGMMCAAEAGKRGRSVLVVDHAAVPGEKIRISGGGRCNFTNSRTAPENFLSQNPQFCISALRRYTASDFIAMVERYGIAYHEKTLGQLFCDGSAQQIIDLLLAEMKQADAELRLGTAVTDVEKTESGFLLTLSPNGSGYSADRSSWRRAASPSPRWAPPISATAWPRGSALPWSRRGRRWCRSRSTSGCWRG